MPSLRVRLYYGFKPLVPTVLRDAVRRWMVRRQRELTRDVWPILPGSERPPAGWPGWPQGKKFALVLTHDVEGRAGISKCQDLMDLEMRHGVRSAFNFIPAGDYRVPRELRDALARNGFETGIHDLHHDGRLYRSRKEFSRKAVKINQYLKDWGAVGFRSGFMLHNLKWLHDLEIEYDLSTFDTDPFEPQPDNIGTIFPCWIPRPEGGGYLELPYTLPQDSTLFLFLGEDSPKIWMDKLDWIASKGGMALVNVHPDYLRFSGQRPSGRTYDVALYEQFLQRVKEKYAGQYWNVLPRDLAAWHKTATAQPAHSLGAVSLTGTASISSFTPARAVVRSRPRRVCMVAYSNYENDNRVLRYAEELAKRGDHVEVIALRRNKEQPVLETINGVHLCRVQRRSRKDQKRRSAFVFPLAGFCLRAFLRLTWRHLRQPYDLVHIHNMPDFLVFAALAPRLMGGKIILDIHDMVPEFYASKFDISSGSGGVKFLKLVERASASFSHHIIISNHLWLDTFAQRNGAAQKCSVFINNVNSNIFWPRPRRRQDSKFIMMFPGGLQWHQGLDIAIRAFHRIAAAAPQAEFHIYGDGNMKQSLIDLAAALNLQERVRFFDPMSVRQIAEVMAEADLGIVPKRADSFGDKAYSTKIMEFMALGVPLIVSSTTIDRYYFNDDVVRFFPSGDDQALGEAMLEMIQNPAHRQEQAARALDYARQHSWETRKDDYLRLVDSLCDAQVGEEQPVFA